MVFAIMELDADRATDEGGPKLGNQFFASIVLALRGNEGGTGKPIDVARRVGLMPISA